MRPHNTLPLDARIASTFGDVSSDEVAALVAKVYAVVASSAFERQPAGLGAPRRRVASPTSARQVLAIDRARTGRKPAGRSCRQATRTFARDWRSWPMSTILSL